MKLLEQNIHESKSAVQSLRRVLQRLPCGSFLNQLYPLAAPHRNKVVGTTLENLFSRCKKLRTLIAPLGGLKLSVYTWSSGTPFRNFLPPRTTLCEGTWSQTLPFIRKSGEIRLTYYLARKEQAPFSRPFRAVERYSDSSIPSKGSSSGNAL